MEICKHCSAVISESMEKYAGEPEPVRSERVRRIVDIFAGDLECHGAICYPLLQEVAKGNGCHVMPHREETYNPYRLPED